MSLLLACAVTRRRFPVGASLLTEGRSDVRVLSAAMEALAPHLADLFSFLDFEGLKLEGSADMLIKMVRAFGARVSTRMLALFDNDAAGAAALSSLDDCKLPPNFRVRALPRSALGAAYPTTGPQGSAIMDVNGLACSIELYLGRESLTNSAGELSPVRWTGYNNKMGRYQGAVEGKSTIVDRFLSALSTCSCPTEARSHFPELASVVDTLSTDCRKNP